VTAACHIAHLDAPPRADHAPSSARRPCSGTAQLGNNDRRAWPLRPEAKFTDRCAGQSRVQPGLECPPTSAGVRGCVRWSSLS